MKYFLPVMVACAAFAFDAVAQEDASIPPPSLTSTTTTYPSSSLPWRQGGGQTSYDRSQSSSDQGGSSSSSSSDSSQSSGPSAQDISDTAQSIGDSVQSTAAAASGIKSGVSGIKNGGQIGGFPGGTPANYQQMSPSYGAASPQQAAQRSAWQQPVPGGNPAQQHLTNPSAPKPPVQQKMAQLNNHPNTVQQAHKAPATKKPATPAASAGKPPFKFPFSLHLPAR